jgi:hypothetical protein
MSADSVPDFRDLLFHMPVEPGRGNGNGSPPENRLARLDRFLRDFGSRLGSRGYAFRISPQAENGGIDVYFASQPGYFHRRFIFLPEGAHQELEGGARQLVGSWREGIIRMICELMAHEQADIDARIENVQGLSRMLAAVRDIAQNEVRPTAPQPSVPPSSSNGKSFDVAHAEWT